MSNTSYQVGSGITPMGALGLIFITLKLCGVIDWSWWWVLSPFWIGFAVILLIFALALLGTLALYAYEGIQWERFKRAIKRMKDQK